MKICGIADAKEDKSENPNPLSWILSLQTLDQWWSNRIKLPDCHNLPRRRSNQPSWNNICLRRK